MIQKNDHSFYESSLLKKLGIFHEYSDRHVGDVTKQRDLTMLLKRMNLMSEETICCEQTHGGIVRRVTSGDRGKEIVKCDGLVYKDDSTYPTALRLRVADCVPILAVDPLARIIGLAHAGWRGTINGIAKNFIKTMEEAGAKKNNIYISIGPHIGMCCYTVLEDRANAFEKRFGKNEKIVMKTKGSWYVDLGYANYQELIEDGIMKKHIDMPVMCTSCNVDDFFSYRKETKETFGEQIAIIGFIR